MTDVITLTICGFIGGVAGEFLGYNNESNKNPLAKLSEVASGFKLFCSFIMSLIAGALTWFYAAEGDVTAMMAAFNIGLSAPVILGAASGKSQSVAEPQ